MGFEVYTSVMIDGPGQNYARLIQFQSQSSVTADDESASLSWCQAPI
jgi:hypothetical protein